MTTPEGIEEEMYSQLTCSASWLKVVVTLDNDEKEIREYPAAELKFKPRRKKKDVRLSKEEIEGTEGVRRKERSVKIR